MHAPGFRSWRWGAALLPWTGLLVLAGMGCAVPKYKVHESDAAVAALDVGSADADAADTADANAPDTADVSDADMADATDADTDLAACGIPDSAPLVLGYCLPDAYPANWSCVEPDPPNLLSVGPVDVVVDSFANTNPAITVTKFAYCDLTDLEHECRVLPGEIAFPYTIPSSQRGYAMVYWQGQGHEGSAAMWHSATWLSRLEVGRPWLATREEANALLVVFGSGRFNPLCADQTVAFVAIQDCGNTGADGVRFAAKVTTSRGPIVAGTHFRIEGGPPEFVPTGKSGSGGIGYLPAGLVTVVGYIGDGCIVAEADVLVRADRVSYVQLVPNGKRP